MEKITIKKSEFQELYDLACMGWKNEFKEKFKEQIFSDTLEFEEEFLIKMNKACNTEQKIVFNKLFKKYLQNNLFEITTYKQVCEKLGVKELTLKDFDFLPEEQRNKALTTHKIMNLEKLFNGNWKVNFKDDSQYKWYPYFNYKNGGSVFFDSGYLISTFRGEAAFYKYKEVSDHVGKHFSDIYKDLI